MHQEQDRNVTIDKEGDDIDYLMKVAEVTFKEKQYAALRTLTRLKRERER
jgi:hypothetical protein